MGVVPRPVQREWDPAVATTRTTTPHSSGGADRLDVAAIERPVALPCRLPDRGAARAHAPGP